MASAMNNSSDSGSESDYNEEAEETLIRNFEAESKLIINNLLPKKSSEVYENVYTTFMQWHQQHKATSYSEDILIVYFNELSKKYKPTTLWAKWSMLRAILNLRHEIDISKYVNLKTFLKNFAKGYKPKKANPFTLNQIKTFLEKADDNLYLVMKVIAIFGICGALRCDEFTRINTADIEHTSTQCIVTIRDSKTTYPRNFVIGPPWYDKVKQYAALRPTDIATDRFFIVYQKGKCHRQVIGKNKISETPNTIALFLNLPDPQKYTGHSFRRSGSTILSNSGANLVAVKSLGGWKSDSVAQGYIDNSLKMKRKNFDDITGITVSNTTTTTTDASKSTLDRPSSSTAQQVPSTSNENMPPIEKAPIHTSESVKETHVQQNKNLHFDKPSEYEEDKSQHALNQNEAIDDIPENNSSALPKKRRITKNSTNVYENNVLDDIDSHATYVRFQNCQIHNLTVNNCSCSNNLQEKTINFT